MITITLNGKRQVFSAPLTVLALLESLKLDPSRVAVEHNLSVLPRAGYAETPLEDGDRVEIVQFVGGG